MGCGALDRGTGVAQGGTPRQVLPVQLRDLTFSTMTDEHRRESRASWTRVDVVNSGVVVALILAAYVYFTG